MVRKALILGFVVFWALITNHCALELVSDLDFLACSPPESETPHQPFDCGDEDACATIESGLYKSEQRQVSAGKAPFLSVAYTLALLAHAVAFEPAASRVPEHSPPELVHTWQFLSRAALPPRAPSFLS